MKPRLLVLLLAAVLAVGCGAPEKPDGPHYVTTINPLRAILAEVVGDRAEVKVLLAPGASPHTYEPRPSDAMAAESALAVFYASEDVDAWAAKLPAKERIAMFAFVPESAHLPYEDSEHAHEGDHDGHHHDYGTENGHFWSDPTVVKMILPALVTKLSALDPEGKNAYEQNAAKFAEDLEKLEAKMKEAFSGMNDRPVFMFHPSWTYFMHRYNLAVAGMIEPSPGKEPTPKFIASLIETAKAKNVRAVFTEPQLPRRPAEVIAEACKLPLYEIDPNGGVDGRHTYCELIEYNAGMLKKALQ